MDQELEGLSWGLVWLQWSLPFGLVPGAIRKGEGLALCSPGRGVGRADNSTRGLRSRAETQLTRGSEVSQGWEVDQTEPGHGWVPRASLVCVLDLPSLPGAPPGPVAWLPRSRVAAGQWAA